MQNSKMASLAQSISNIDMTNGQNVNNMRSMMTIFLQGAGGHMQMQYAEEEKQPDINMIDSSSKPGVFMPPFMEESSMDHFMSAQERKRAETYYE